MGWRWKIKGKVKKKMNALSKEFILTVVREMPAKEIERLLKLTRRA